MTIEEREQGETAILAVFQSVDGQTAGPSLQLPTSITPEQMELVLNQLLQNDEKLPYTFSVQDKEIVKSIQEDILKSLGKSTEETITITYRPQALFRVRRVTRCSSTLAGHTESVLSVQFSPDGRCAASGSGDTTVRLWDLDTETPRATCTGHKNWVLTVSFSPDGRMLASGGMDGLVMIWDTRSGRQLAILRGHSKWITGLAWEPFHLNAKCNRLASASKDGTVRVWNVQLKQMEFSLTQHTDAVSCVKWGGTGLIYTGSRDKSVKVWSAKEGKLCKTLSGHAHWVNTMALSTDFVLRLGPFDHQGRLLLHTGNQPTLDLNSDQDRETLRQACQARYDELTKAGTERLVTGSDDFTLFLWSPTISKAPITRMTGHQNLINHVAFSPSTDYIASASFDKSVKLWNGSTGKFICNLRAHVGCVYWCSWSADSRLLVSASKDSTLKLWDVRTGKMVEDLPGHADEVFSVDWTASGESRVISGGRDRMIKFWRQ